MCGCHGEPMRWSKDSRPRYKAGGYWRCSIKQTASRKRYDQTEAGRSRHRRYGASERGRERSRRYNESPGGAVTRQLHEITRVRINY